MDRKQLAQHIVMAVGAVTFALAGAVGYAGLAPPPPALVDYEGGQLVAMGELESTLYNPALDNRGAGFAAEMEFRSAEGATCRRFARSEVSGVACKHNGDWRLVSLQQAWPKNNVAPPGHPVPLP